MIGFMYGEAVHDACVQLGRELGSVGPPDAAFDRAFDDKCAAQNNARSVQVGGDHYSKLAIQPFEFAMRNGFDPGQTLVLRYITRYKDKNGIEDLRKARHVIDLMIEMGAGK